jgi:type II secretory pathway component PulJ
MDNSRQGIEARRGLRKCAGVSMIEMLISLTLAMVLLVSLVMLYFGAAKSAAKEENISSASRAGRLISRRLARDFRLVGLMAQQDVDGDSNDINRDVPGEVWSDTTRDDFEYATTYELVFVGDIDNDDHTETVRLFLSGDTLHQETWEWSRVSRSWVGPIDRVLGSNVDHIIFDYFDRDDTRIPDTTGYASGGFMLSPGQRRRITSVEVTLCLRSASEENRQPETVALPDGTTYNDTFRRAVIQFQIRGRNLTLGV